MSTFQEQVLRLSALERKVAFLVPEVQRARGVFQGAGLTNHRLFSGTQGIPGARTPESPATPSHPKPDPLLTMYCKWEFYSYTGDESSCTIPMLGSLSNGVLDWLSVSQYPSSYGVSIFGARFTRMGAMISFDDASGEVINIKTTARTDYITIGGNNPQRYYYAIGLEWTGSSRSENGFGVDVDVSQGVSEATLIQNGTTYNTYDIETTDMYCIQSDGSYQSVPLPSSDPPYNTIGISFYQ